MPDASQNELRWLLGKIIHCASNAESVAEFEEWMADVAAPEELLAEINADVREDRSHEAAHTAFVAACWLYGHGSAEESAAHNTIRSAFTRLWDLPIEPQATATVDAPDPEAPSPDAGAQPVDSSSGSSAEPVPGSADQALTVGRDVNAPIVNAPGGHVVINDRSGEADKLLHDYRTLLIHVSFGVKLPDAVDSVRPLVEDAMASLVAYHAKTDETGIGRHSELMRDAPEILDKLDRACRAVFGLGFDESRPELTQLAPPGFELFEDMLLVKGGIDAFTGETVRPFYLSRFPVTVAQYAEFCQRVNYPPIPEWESMAPAAGIANHPVTGMALFDTVMFCVWLELATGFRFRVVTEAEWCFAATGGRRLRYPWGDEYVAGHATTQLESPTGTQPVDAHPGGVTWCGAADMIGNVWELTSSLFDEDVRTPKRSFTFPPMMFALARPHWWETDRRIPQGAGPWQEAARFVMRGGSFGGGPEWASMDERIWTSAFNRGAYGGFRIACSAEAVGEGYVPAPSYLASGIGAVAERIQLTGKDGSDALTQKHFSSCGSGGTWQGKLRGQLIEGALARWEPSDPETSTWDPLDPFRGLARSLASETSFPRLRPRTSWSSASAPPPSKGTIEERCRRRLAPASWRVLVAAWRSAVDDQDGTVRTDHLLAALSNADDLFVARVVAALGLERHLGLDGDDGSPPGTDLRLTAGMELVLDLAPSSNEDVASYKGHIYPDELLSRLVEFQDEASAPVLRARGVTGEHLRRTMESVRIGEGLLGGWGGGTRTPEAIEASVEVYRTIEASFPELAIAPLSALLTARVNALAANDVPNSQAIAEAEREASRYRSQLLSAGEDEHLRGLSKLLHTRFGQLFAARRFAEAIALLDQAIVIDEAATDDDSRLALAWALVNRGAALFESGAADAAVDSSRQAVPILRSLIRQERADNMSMKLLVMALANQAEAELTGGDAVAAQSTVDRALSVGLPFISYHRPALAPGLVNTEHLRDTLHLCYEGGEQPVPEDVLAFLDAAVAGDRDMSELPRPDFPPVSLDPASRGAGSEEFCSFCGDRPDVLGLRGAICAACLGLASQVFSERAAMETPPPETKYKLLCSMCGWQNDGHLVVSGKRGRICLECRGRALEAIS